MDSLKRISIFDTTLRDGEAAPGNSMTWKQKVEIALELEALGVDVIEPGFPASSELDYQVAKELSSLLRRSRINLFCRSSRSDIDIGLDAMQGGAAYQTQILTVGSDIHLEHKRRMTRQEAIAEAADAVAYARQRGIEEISVAPEDCTRGDHEYLRQLTEACMEAGATMVGIPDTVGAALPHEYADLVRSFRQWIGPSARIGVHCHDDMGLAVANALAGIEAGAVEVQATLCGIGERAGNTALEELVAVLAYKRERFHASCGIDERMLFQTATRLAQEIRLPLTRHKSVIGDNVFATEAGMHQAGLLRNPITYEFLEPERFGRQRTIYIGRHSGRTVIKHRLASQGVAVRDDLV